MPQPGISHYPGHLQVHNELGEYFIYIKCNIDRIAVNHHYTHYTGKRKEGSVDLSRGLNIYSGTRSQTFKFALPAALSLVFESFKLSCFFGGKWSFSVKCRESSLGVIESMSSTKLT